MLGYYFHLALRSLRRDFALTALAVLSIGVGIGASMSMLTILRAASGDPIPQKSAELFVPQIDNFGPQPGAPPTSQDQLPPNLTYTDAIALVRAHVAALQAAMYPVALTITVPGTRALPLQGEALATGSAFFPMFDVPFEYGGPWRRAEDDSHAAVVVLTQSLNEQLFGGSNSVGRSLTINGQPYRVIGVLAAWHPSPRFFNLGFENYTAVEQLYAPFTRAIDEHIETAGHFNCSRQGPGNGWTGILQSNCIWIRAWVELPSRRAFAQYRVFLRNYAAEQRQEGRFNWPPHVALRDVMQWLAYNHVVPASVRTLTGVAFAILLVCLFNATGLMLAKFMARAPVVGVRRALGATRGAVFAQGLVEAGVIGLAGGLLGMGLSKEGLMGCRAVLNQDLFVLTQLRVTDMVIALVLAVLATLLAGLYPTWRAAQVQPAAYLKTQ